MNLCMGSLLWLKCHLHNKTPPCFLCWFSNNTVSYTVGISPTACTKSAIFRRFLTPLQKLDIIRIILRNSHFVKVFFSVFYFLLQKVIHNLSPKLSTTFSFKNVVDKSYPQIVDNLCITLGIIQKNILKPLVLRQTFFCGYCG